LNQADILKAVIKNDEIIKLSLTTGVEIGEIPKGVGLERLRWTGTELVDLGTLDVMYRHKRTGKLHARRRPGTEKVRMKYKDRKNLIRGRNGRLRPMRPAEILARADKDYRKFRKAEYPEIGDQLDAILFYLNGLPEPTPELRKIIKRVKEVKVRYPKPKERARDNR
jgi:hypothetical protein